MKRIILSVALVFCIVYLNAQGTEGIVALYATQKKWEDAKKEVDKWLASPKLKNDEKTMAYLWELTVYSQIFSDSSLTTKYPGADEVAIDALNQYVALEPSLKQLKENFSAGVGSIYGGSFNKGKDYFQSKQYDSAFKYFSRAQSLGSFLLVNKLSVSTATIDTVSVLYTAYSAQNAKLLDSAAKYYSILADIKISGPDYEDVYKFLVEYYYQKKEDATFKKYLAMAKELYPADTALWTQYEMSNMTANSNLTELLQKYHQESAGGTLNEDKLTAYAEAFATTDNDQLSGLDSMQKINLKLTAADAFAKAFDMNKNGLYAFNVGVIYYSLYGALDDRYVANRGEGTGLKAKRAEILKDEMAYADTASQWLEKGYPLLKDKQDRSRAEVASLNRTVDYLANIYYWERDQTKINGNTKDYDKYDALYKKYDAEHNSYK